MLFRSRFSLKQTRNFVCRFPQSLNRGYQKQQNTYNSFSLILKISTRQVDEFKEDVAERYTSFLQSTHENASSFKWRKDDLCASFKETILYLFENVYDKKCITKLQMRVAW